ncbi:hypothetical protein MSI_03880 [Treponema sp. JC4]|uniref:hypothetical protein n=1 Tax=Treponema sp. JC4 TaxID=1124982 RepID=UPI00025B0D69|nr:hypothetical protein [Treponema sp. JC4]EID85959.1 hypothetical protein MSI_03880 [Treponema sp. JC4]
MKKFLKLALAVAALATMFGFASCSNDSSNDSTATTPAATTTTTLTAADYKGKTFASEDGTAVFSFISESQLFYGKFVEGNSSDYKYKIINYSVSDGKVTADGNKTASLSGTTLTVDDATLKLISGSNNSFAGKAFISENKKIFIAFISDSKVFAGLDNGDGTYANALEDYAVSGSTASWNVGINITATISGDVLTEVAEGYGTYTLNLVK